MHQIANSWSESWWVHYQVSAGIAWDGKDLSTVNDTLDLGTLFKSYSFDWKPLFLWKTDIPKRTEYEIISCTEFAFSLCFYSLQCYRSLLFGLYEMSHAQINPFYTVLKLITWTQMRISGVLFFFSCSDFKGVTELSHKLLVFSSAWQAAFDHWQLCFLHCFLTKIPTVSINM